MKLVKYILVVLIYLTQSSKAQISVYGAVEHIVPDGIDTQGNVTLSVSGSTSPYTYTWNPGSVNTKDISNVSSGHYTVNIRSASSQTLNAYYKMGYKTIWTNLYRGIYRNDSLLNVSSTSSWFANATSKNTLTSGTDGWFEYVITNLSGYSHWIGFSDSISNNIGNADIDYGFYYNGAAKDVYTTHLGSSQTLVNNNINVGDVIRLERTGNVLKYLINNLAVKTITVSGVSSKNFKLKACLAGSNVFRNVGCSFANLSNTSVPGYVKIIPYVKHVSSIGSTNGVAKVTPTIPLLNTYSWSPSGATTNSISSLGFGTYPVTIKDSLNNESKTVLRVGYKTQWTNLDYCYSRNDSLVITTGYTNKWCHAVSKNTLKPNVDGWFEYILSFKGQDCFIGFTDSITPIRHYNSIDYGFLCDGGTGSLFYIENSTINLLNTYVNYGDVLSLERVGNTIKYIQNGQVLRSVTISGISQKFLKLQCNMTGNGSVNISRITDVGCSFLEEDSTSFKNYVNVASVIKHCSGPGINDGRLEITPTVPFSNTYSWIPSGSSSSSLTALSFGNYSVTVTDSLQNKSTHHFNVGYKVNWTNMNRCFSRNDSLIGNGSSVQYATAQSKNTLKPYEDGWFETRVYYSGSYDSYIGFTDSISPLKGSPSFKAIDYGFNYSTGSGPYLSFYQSGTIGALYAVIRPGDMLRLERIGNTINYKINGVLMKTITVPGISAKSFKLQANMEYISRFSNVGCSFYDMDSTNIKNYVQITPIIKHSSGVGINNGSTIIKPKGSAFKNVNWQPAGVTSATLNLLNNSTNTVTVTDSLSNSSDYVINTGYKANWTNMSFAIFRNDSLLSTKTSGGYGYARTKNYLDANTDGWVETTITFIGAKHYYIGFVDSAANSNSTLSDIQYGFWHSASNSIITYYESGVNGSMYATPTIGDVLRIERIGNTINYKINGVTLRTVTNTLIGAKVLRVKAMLTQNYLANVGTSFTQCTYTVDAGATQTISCSNPSVTLTGTTTVPSPSYTWSAGGTSPNSYTTAVSSPGIYTLTVSNSTGCMAASTVAVVGSTVAPSITIESSSPVPTLGLNAYWPFNGNADDVSGNANNGTITDATLTYDRFGNPNKAYYFNGSTSRIDVPNSSTVDMPNGQDYSISFWMKAKPGNVDATPIAKNQYGAWSGYMFFANSTNGGYCNTPDHGSFYVAAGGGGDVCSNNAIYNDTTNWYFITGQYQASTNQAFMYVNSVLQTDIGSASGATSNTKQLSFGAYNDAAGFGYFKGALDDIRFYNRLLTQSEINNLYNEIKTTASNVVIDTTIVLQASPNISGITYTWSPGGSSSNSYSTSISSPGVYSLSVTNPTTGCVSSATVLVVTKLSATATVTDYENDTVKGQVTLNITGGVPPYNIAWNGLKYPLPAAAYKLLKDSISGIVIDSVKFVNYIDSIRQITVYNDLLPSTNYAVIYDQSSDSIILSVSVSNKINNWAAKVGAVTTSNPINKLSVGNVNYFYGSGVDIVQSGTFALGNSYAVLPNTIDLNKVNEISFIVPNNMDVTYVGLVDQNSPLSGTYYDLNQKTMFKFNGNGSFDVIFNSQSIYNGSFGAGDYFSIKANNTTGKIGYYKNEALLIEADISGLNMGGTLLLSKVVLGNANASVAGLKIKLPYVIGPIQILPFNKCFLYSILYSANASANPNPVCAGSNVTLLGSLTESSFFSSPQTVSLPSNSYSWLPGNLVGAGPLTAVVQSSQIYTLSVSYVGCVFKKTIAVNTYNLNANAGADVFVTSGTNVTLGVAPLSATGGSGNYSYVWTPAGTYVPNAMVPTPVITSNSSITYTLTVTDNVTGCISIDDKLVYLINEPYYFVLKKKMDAGYYNSYNNKIYFKFEEEYYDGTNTLMYSIVDDKNLIMALPSLNPGEMIGDNQYSLILSNIPSLIPGNFYRLSITNKKNEVFYARFKY